MFRSVVAVLCLWCVASLAESGERGGFRERARVQCVLRADVGDDGVWDFLSSSRECDSGVYSCERRRRLSGCVSEREKESFVRFEVRRVGRLTSRSHQ